MRRVLSFVLPAFVVLLTSLPASGASKSGSAPGSPNAQQVDAIFGEALTHGQAYDRLRELTSDFPGRLSGSKNLEGAVQWGRAALEALGVDRVALQDVMVTHWERGTPEAVRLLAPNGTSVPLAAAALGNSAATPDAGITGEVVEVKSLEEIDRLGRAGVAGKIVFYNRPMDPAVYLTMNAYATAGDQRNRGPGVAAKYGAVAVLVRSLTELADDVPHTGNTTFPVDVSAIPAAAISVVAADKLHAALGENPAARVSIAIHARTLPPAPSHNVVAEIRGSEFPNEIIVVGGHLDSWDIAPGAHDDGAGVVQSMEVLRIFRALGLKPRHTLRCVLFTNEENGLAGGRKYAELALAHSEKHLFALESDNGGFSPAGFTFNSGAGQAEPSAARWRALFEPWGVWSFVDGGAGADVGPLLAQGAVLAELRPYSQRYFDYHHSRSDSLDKVNARELHLGAAAMAALVWLVDHEGL